MARPFPLSYRANIDFFFKKDPLVNRAGLHSIGATRSLKESVASRRRLRK
jgi:hypothetical protein